MVERLNAANVLLTGTDAGNIRNKVSFLNANDEIESFSIPTVYAPAPSSKVKIESKHKAGNKIPGENMLHVRITSKALPADKSNYFYYVGEFARDKENRFEPGMDTGGQAQSKFNNELHIVTTLTSLAVAAFKSNKEVVNLPYSGGLPINEYKKVGAEKVLDIFIGQHEIKVLDGEFEGKSVKIKITEGDVHPEGITSSLALFFDIKKGELIETELASKLGNEFALGDLGAGTTDKALYDENGLNKSISDSDDSLGTNKYVDEILEKITQMDAFAEIRESIENNSDRRPFRTREDFMRKVIEPEIMNLLDHEKEKKEYTPKFTVDWLWMKDVDVTEIVVDGMKRYAMDAIKALNQFWGKSQAKNFVLVGGGLLFGYIVFREDKYKKRFTFPPNIKEAAYTTSRAYLIANYLDQLEKFAK